MCFKAPLPPLSKIGARGGGSAGKKALPPLRKPPPVGIGGQQDVERKHESHDTGMQLKKKKERIKVLTTRPLLHFLFHTDNDDKREEARRRPEEIKGILKLNPNRDASPARFLQASPKPVNYLISS